jgi:hypothetical protein
MFIIGIIYSNRLRSVQSAMWGLERSGIHGPLQKIIFFNFNIAYARAFIYFKIAYIFCILGLEWN